MIPGPRFTGITAGDQPIEMGVEHALPPATSPQSEALTLMLEDLIPDARNEVVILDHTGQDIAVVTHEAVAAQGIEDAHVTASGLDVSGFSYCTFEGGITVFYPATHRFLVTQDG